MSRMLLALLVCLPAIAMGNAFQCKFGDKVVNPGETFTFEQNCAKHTCTCDATKSGSDACKSVMIGCLNSATNTCHMSGDHASITSTSGSPLQCVCQQAADGSFSFANCRSETCKDSRTNEEKKKGESVNYAMNGANYVCTCGGIDGYQNCRSEEAIKNDGKCLDQASGSYVATGSPATTKQGDTVLHCTCAGTNSYSNCRTATCADADGSTKNAGEKVTVKNGDAVLICDCAGLEGYKNCQNKADLDNAAKCKDIEGKYIEKGHRYRVQYGALKYDCLCDGNNSGKECTLV